MSARRAEAVKGILWLCLVYWLVTGKWPEIPAEVIDQCLDRAEAPAGGPEKMP